MTTTPARAEAGRLPASSGAGERPVGRARRLAGPLAVAGLAAGALAVTAVFDPNEPGHYPLCPTQAIAGVDCPGCGSLRAMHALGRGDLGAAADHNLLLVAALPVLAWIWLRWVRRSWLGLPRPEPVSGRWVWGLLALVAVFAVVRNLPGMPFLGSGLG